jgi:UDP-N-acetylglucosamine--N-acetylmuramyl-(pentapeptide) pyrophosphoryl-undecaprenol N-acetylglucosamine transferase
MQPGGYLFAGGGTGGHLFPALVVANALRDRDPSTRVLFVGSDRPLETRIVTDAGYEHVALPTPCTAMARRQPVKYAVRFWRATQQARQTVAEFRPRVVIGCGGFTSVPPVLAAFRAKTPVVLLEQNLLPGRATRWLSRRASAVCLAFEESRQFLSQSVCSTVTGNPVRPELAACSSRPFESGDSAPQLLILGGSLGAEEINAAVMAGIGEDVERWRDWRIVHQTGERTLEEVRCYYRKHGLNARVEPFLNDVPAQLCSATVVVTRAGATSLAEAACAGAACVIVPWKRAADDHQTLNARWYADRGGALLASGTVSGDEGLWHAVLRLADTAELRESLSMRMQSVARPASSEEVIKVLDTAARTSAC